ncbi:MAG: hypothetical protein LBV28_02130 [Puniceicoccales bacterium]|jgi:hypothetical protein|nr:hypothetical protein [Puniceicoccales bacterium]
MNTFKLAALAVIFGATTAAAHAAPDAAAPVADIVVPIPPLKVPTASASLVAAGDWASAKPLAALDYAATKKLAVDAEAAGKTADALTAWERVIDRTVCDDEARAEARAHIKELRPKVQINADPAKAKTWKVLALIYKEVDMEVPGKAAKYHRVMTEENLATIGKELAGWRDLVFEYSSGLLLLEFDAVVVTEPLTHLSSSGGGKFHVDIRDAAPAAKKAFAKQKYDTVISYAKFRGGDGPDVPRPFWVAATVGRVRDFDGAGYIMIPWGDDYPFVKRGELWGEMELHEWLHQMDDVVHKNLGYPRGVAQNPDKGGHDNEYVRPRDCHTWAYFYRHIMAEHITRQVWTEVSTNERLLQKTGAPINPRR